VGGGRAGTITVDCAERRGMIEGSARYPSRSPAMSRPTPDESSMSGTRTRAARLRKEAAWLRERRPGPTAPRRSHLLWCGTCGRRVPCEAADIDRYARLGWPKCCWHMMYSGPAVVTSCASAGPVT
jgi:hypothetical protein